MLVDSILHVCYYSSSKAQPSTPSLQCLFSLVFVSLIRHRRKCFHCGGEKLDSIRLIQTNVYLFLFSNRSKWGDRSTLEAVQTRLGEMAHSLVFFCERMADHDDVPSSSSSSSVFGGGLGGGNIPTRTFCVLPSRNTWPVLSRLFKEFAARVSLGVPAEYIPLTEIKGVRASRAKLLWAAGYRNVRAIAHANQHELAKRAFANEKFGAQVAHMVIHNATILLDAAAEDLRNQAAQLQSR
jgi:hypothetical protein